MMLENRDKLQNDFNKSILCSVKRNAPAKNPDSKVILYSLEDIDAGSFSSEKLWEILRDSQNLLTEEQRHLYQSVKKELQARGRFDIENPWMPPH
ncbi:MAG: hypothetical protein KDI30_06965 [Pseudomonadales bacterium]|nr:hypothetical protein [Pseudomonadales bacterium]